MGAPKLALIGLGANLTSSTGFPDATLRAALCRIVQAGGRIAAVSRFWRTPAFPRGSGPDFVNACAALQTERAPPELLAQLHRIEAELGRTRAGGRWSARAIDLDLLAVEGEVWPDAATQAHWQALPPARQALEAPATLILPHPRLQDRGFVLAPLADIAPLWRHPQTGLTVAEMLVALPPEEVAEMRPFP